MCRYTTDLVFMLWYVYLDRKKRGAGWGNGFAGVQRVGRISLSLSLYPADLWGDTPSVRSEPQSNSPEPLYPRAGAMYVGVTSTFYIDGFTSVIGNAANWPGGEKKKEVALP